MALADIFRKYKKNGISKGEVAAHLSMDQGYLSKIISGQKPLTEENAKAINEKYGYIAVVEATKGVTIAEAVEKTNSLRREFEEFKKETQANLDLLKKAIGTPVHSEKLNNLAEAQQQDLRGSKADVVDSKAKRKRKGSGSSTDS